MESAMNVFDPENDSNREQFRRFSFRKRQSASSVSPIEGNSASRFTDARLLYDDDNMQPRPNVALLLEDIKQEVENFDNEGLDVVGKAGSHLLKSCKREDDVLAEGGESTFILFASLLDSAIQGLMPFSDLILQFENTCRNVSESIRFGNSGRHRIFEDKLMRQRAQLLLDEAASWSLLWYLFGKGNEVHPEDLILLPTTSHQEACQYVMGDHTAQLCLRIVQWLEGLASEALDLEEKVRGSHVGSYLPSSGVWHHTQRFLKKRNDDPAIVQHLDFDAPTREVAQLLPDDKKQDESLLEDVWILLRAGRLEEACELCRSAGKSWRAATLTSFGGLDPFPSIEALQKNGKSRTLQALELESGIGRQLRLWKWASYYTSEKIADQDGGKYEAAVYASRCGNLKRMLPVCTDWESACWAMAKSWLDTQVDLYLGQVQQDEPDPSKSNCDSVMNGSSRQEGQSLQVPLGPESWPCHVLDQQPLDLPALLQKLHSSDIVNEVVCRGCKDHHRQIEMNLMTGDIAQLLDLLWSWMSPLEDDKDVLRPHIDPQMIRFGAHLVLVLRHLLAGEVDTFREKLMTVGDFILQMYTMFLFSKNHEELIGIYASQLAPHRCIDLFVNMMELRMNDSVQVKYKIFLSAIEYLPFSTGDGSKGWFESIIERVLQRSRDIKIGNCDKTFYVSEQKHSQSLQKATAIQWLCFTPPSTINDLEIIKAKLLLRALMHSNVLFREFALVSMWRVPRLPLGAHMLLSCLSELLKQPRDTLLSFDGDNMSENLREFEDWREYYSCDAAYRKWLKLELENANVSPSELSTEEKKSAVIAARETLNLSLPLLLRKGSSWLTSAQNRYYTSSDHVFIHLHAIVALCLPSGECMHPDATLCTTLTSALYSSVSEEDLMRRQLMVNVSPSTRDDNCFEVVLRCLAVNGDGLGLHESNDGGLLATVMAAGFKGELLHFQAGIKMEISRLDAWYSDEGGSLESPAAYIVKGLCRICCLPEIILRCMQVSVSLAEAGDSPDLRDELIELVASSQSGMLQLFSQHQLQEFLLFERECSLYTMEHQEELMMFDT